MPNPELIATVLPIMVLDASMAFAEHRLAALSMIMIMVVIVQIFVPEVVDIYVAEPTVRVDFSGEVDVAVDSSDVVGLIPPDDCVVTI